MAMSSSSEAYNARLQEIKSRWNWMRQRSAVSGKGSRFTFSQGTVL